MSISASLDTTENRGEVKVFCVSRVHWRSVTLFQDSMGPPPFWAPFWKKENQPWGTPIWRHPGHFGQVRVFFCCSFLLAGVSLEKKTSTLPKNKHRICCQGRGCSFFPHEYCGEGSLPLLGETVQFQVLICDSFADRRRVQQGCTSG